jgi:hypothetical protein
MGIRRDGNKTKVIEQLRFQPIVTVACKRSDVATATYYRWRKEDGAFALAADQAQAEGTLIVNDAIESKLINLALEGNPILIMYYLNNRHSKYYLQRAPRPPTNLESLEEELMEKHKQADKLIKNFTDDTKNLPKSFKDDYSGEELESK